MASTCFRAAARVASAVGRSAAAARPATFAGRAASAASRAPCFSRVPVELGCCAGLSLLPLHSAVAAARLTSRLSTDSSCRALSQEMGLSVPR
ncbi:protein NUCLEAR FUSION DEFECTIVE 6, mitochondrial-like isoform X2 [Panicum virgatum]|uniref:protein NUCLEAR FUSION DEFECTIVE 6, mitochondrial-like isoform X2 n=1 Tax=Panicum virgatum TaxID=38727 RepID=UPI0019D65C8B|nr:protein NUCLEAR FUSION DEFECTIVE 6, mitochondrial-like isoform X2 [Panicum virgatum]